MIFSTPDFVWLTYFHNRFGFPSGLAFDGERASVVRVTWRHASDGESGNPSDSREAVWLQIWHSRQITTYRLARSICEPVSQHLDGAGIKRTGQLDRWVIGANWIF
jgi:hypothetical protein